MRLSTQVKPISYFKARAAEIIDELDDGGEPLVITKNGEAKAVVMSVVEYERTQETLALLQIVSLAEREIAMGKTIPVEQAFDRVQEELRAKYGC